MGKPASFVFPVSRGWGSGEGLAAGDAAGTGALLDGGHGDRVGCEGVAIKGMASRAVYQLAVTNEYSQVIIATNLLKEGVVPTGSHATINSQGDRSASLEDYQGEIVSIWPQIR